MSIKDKYTFVENKDAKWQGIGLTEAAGKYQGIVYRYGKVSFGKKEDKNGNLPLHFEWDVLDSNGLPKENMGEDFFHLIGDILQDLLMEQVNQGSLQYVNTEH
tara:strand:- start:589 stop:897 length:309 start_codon:yes stop_codon:yes gene_type:complete